MHYFAPPVAVVSSRRLSGIYRELAIRADSIDIITSNNHRHRNLEEAYSHEFPLHFVEGEGLREKLFGTREASVNSQQKASRGFRLLNRWRQSFPVLLLTDEGGPAYYRNAVRKASRIIESRGITHLFSSYRPWVDHRIARALKKRYPHLIWIADFRDLPVDRVRRDVALPTLQKWWVKRIIQRADEVWLVSEGQRKQFGTLHPNPRVVYNGLFSLPKPSEPEPGKTFTIGYTGSLYPGLQSVEMLGGALEQLVSNFEEGTNTPEISLQYIGKEGAVLKDWVGGDFGFLYKCKYTYLCIYKYMNLQKTHHLQSTHTLNLLLTWSAPNYHGVLTAKLFDYLAAGRPIMAIVNGPDDPELRRIIEGSGAGRVFCRGQEHELADWLQELYFSWRENGNRLPWRTEAKHLASLAMAEQLKDLPSR
ncbi:hypothetical protein CEQ90_06460 [Lewinellaceae bacterium SD302]|nr:hypothetical protein CEQ90_06460 [Lewinellaceae bacterium SD302]